MLAYHKYEERIPEKAINATPALTLQPSFEMLLLFKKYYILIRNSINLL